MFGEELEDQPLGQAQAVFGPGKFLAMAAEGTGEIGEVGKSGRCIGERGGIGQAKQIPGGLAGLDLVCRNRLALVPQQAQRLGRKLAETDEAHCTGIMLQRNHFEVGRRRFGELRETTGQIELVVTVVLEP